MTLYTDSDLSLFEENINNVIDDIDNIVAKTIEPTRDKILEINNIIFDFIREKKRKIYGGYAQNKVISIKNKKDAFYDENNIPDIDFYSPKPIDDVFELCNILHTKGYEYVNGREAQHKETYTIFVYFENVCDISYVPTNIYNRIPFIELDGMNYVHPSFSMIDMYRMFTEPYFSSFRWEKVFPRVFALQKHYPFPVLKKSIPDTPSMNSLIFKTIYDYIINKTTLIINGLFAYNYYLDESGILNDKSATYYHYMNIPYFDIISTNYREDALSLISEIGSKHPDVNITAEEYYPFWQFLGYSILIKCDNNVVVRVIHHDKRCTPYKSVEPKIVDRTKFINSGKGLLQIGSFDYLFLSFMINSFHMRTKENKEMELYYKICVSHLIEMRSYYFKKNNKTFFDDTLFQEFLITCTGSTIRPFVETFLSRKKKKDKGRLFIFSYDPTTKATKPEYKFPNSSGNIINNEHNLRVMKSEQINNKNSIDSNSSISTDIMDDREIIEKR